MKRLSLSVQEKEHLFQSELIKACVPRPQAVAVARILIQPADEPLTEAEVQLTRQVCQQWLKQRQRQAFIAQVCKQST